MEINSYGFVNVIEKAGIYYSDDI